MSGRTFVAGGAGFIGSHVTRRLLALGEEVVVFDNFTSGRREHLPDDPALTVVEGDLKDPPAIAEALAACGDAFHLAANPDIAKAMTDPGIDFREGTVLAQNVLEAIRQDGGVKRLVYASGSGVHGDQGALEVDETFGPLLPISTYGASKVACEALISAYCHMFGLRAVGFRFANVVGPRQGHGVVYDFVHRLLDDPAHLTVLGDGSQSKSYIYVDDVIDAMLLLRDDLRDPFDVFFAGTGDYTTVREIAELVIARMELEGVEIAYGDSARGWKGDVPVVRFSSAKLHARGWGRPRSSHEALGAAADAIIAEARAARPA